MYGVFPDLSRPLFLRQSITGTSWKTEAQACRTIKIGTVLHGRTVKKMSRRQTLTASVYLLLSCWPRQPQHITVITIQSFAYRRTLPQTFSPNTRHLTKQKHQAGSLRLLSCRERPPHHRFPPFPEWCRKPQSPCCHLP